MTDIVAVRVTCPDAATAARIAAAIVERRLAACAHVEPAIESRYRWRGRIETATETPLTLKTRAALFETLAAAVRALHPYETPAIVATALAATPDYAAWVVAETEGAE